MLIDTAELAGMVVECCLYGIFITLASIALYGFLRARGVSVGFSSHTVPMLIAGTLLVILCTARLVADAANIFVAFIRNPDRPSRTKYLTDVTAPLFIFKHSLLAAVLFVGDSFVNWRCWVVWGKRLWIVIVPIILSMASATCGSYPMWAYTHLPHQVILSELPWLTSFYTLSLVANAMSTSLLAYRIWKARSQANQIQPSTYTNAEGLHVSRPGRISLKPILYIIMESGALNAAYLFVYTMCLVSGSQGLEVMSEMACQLPGIIFMIVIIRVGLHARPDAYWPKGSTQGSGVTSGTANSRLVFALGKKGMNESTTVGNTTTTTTYGEVDVAFTRHDDVELGTFHAEDNHSIHGKSRPL